MECKRSAIFLITLIAISMMTTPSSNGDTILTHEVSSYFEDDFSSDTGIWDYNGVAYRDTSENYVVLTNAQQSTWGHIWLNFPIEGPFTVSFRYKAGGGTGADGLTFLFYQTKEVDGHLPTNVAGSMLSGAYDTNGYGIEFDNYQNGHDPSANHIALRDYQNNHLAFQSASSTVDNLWHQVIISVGLEHIVVAIDANVVLSWVGVIDRTNTAFGFGAACGADTNWHFIGDFSLWVLNTEEVSSISDWPFFHQNVRHTGISNSDGPTSDQLLWTYETGSQVFSSPSVVDNRIYVGSSDQYLYCLNADTGELIWRFQADNGIESSPAVVYGRVYFGSYDSYVYCLDAENGSLYWKYKTGGGVRSSPIIVENFMYIGSQDGSLYCLNAFTGTKIWSKTVAGQYFYYTSPAYYEGKIFVIGNQVFCLDAHTGETIWSKPTYSDSNASPVIEYGYVYIGYSRPGWGRVDCFNVNNGELIWSYTPRAAVCSTPTVADGKIFFGSCDDRLYALNAYNGDEIWSFYANSYEIRSSPAYANGLLYFGDHNLDYVSGSFYCLNASNGNLVWKYVTGHEQIFSSPAIVDGRAYVGASNGIIYCFETTLPYFGIVIDQLNIDDTRVDVDRAQNIRIHASWNNGSNARECVIILNGENYTTGADGWIEFNYNQSTVGIKKWTVTGVECNNISDFNQLVDDPFVIWDKIDFIYDSSQRRFDIGTDISSAWSGIYVYDGSPFFGSITLNDTIKTTVGEYGYKIDGINDRKYDLDLFESDSVDIIFDTIDIHLLLDSSRVEVGKEANIEISGNYRYDNETFYGTVTLNNELIKNQIGKFSYKAIFISDPLYGLDTFNTNEIDVIFDKILHEVEASNGFPGSIDISITLNFQTDDLNVEDAVVLVNDRRATYRERGVYEIKLNNWLPQYSVEILIDRPYFERIVLSFSGYAYVNLIFELFLIICIGVSIVLYNRRLNRNKNLLRIERMKKIESILLTTDQIELKEISELMDLSTNEVKKLIQLLIDEGKLHGLFSLDGDVFMKEEYIENDIRKRLK